MVLHLNGVLTHVCPSVQFHDDRDMNELRH